MTRLKSKKAKAVDCASPGAEQSLGSTLRCYNRSAHREEELRGWMAFPVAARSACRGVAQPGRAPGSGPGGRRFKSSLPDQFFRALKLHFCFFRHIDGVRIGSAYRLIAAWRTPPSADLRIG